MKWEQIWKISSKDKLARRMTMNRKTGYKLIVFHFFFSYNKKNKNIETSAGEVIQSYLFIFFESSIRIIMVDFAILIFCHLILVEIKKSFQK